MKTLPKYSRILPYSIQLRVPGFINHYYPGIATLAPCPIQSEEWFDKFTDRVIQSLGRQYYPVCRMSDGEYRFLLGDQPLDANWPLSARLKNRIQRCINYLNTDKSFSAGGLSDKGEILYVSGRYYEEEIKSIKDEYTRCLCEIAHDGTLALHLTHGTPQPFQQHYFEALGRWLKDNGIVIDLENYVPFYFVYALLQGPKKDMIIKNRRILVVHSANGSKKSAIIERLKTNGASKVHWLGISQDRSCFDRLNPEEFIGKVDICFVGAGVGKPMVLTQLKILQVPCIDAGYVFEVWADPTKAHHRAYMLPDYDPLSANQPYLNTIERAHVCKLKKHC